MIAPTITQVATAAQLAENTARDAAEHRVARRLSDLVMGTIFRKLGGYGHSTVLMVGDSTMRGVGSGPVAGIDQERASLPAVLATRLARECDLLVNESSVIGDGFIGGGLDAFDPQIDGIGTSGWMPTGTFGLGGRTLAAGADPMRYSPTEPTDTLDLLCRVGPDAGDLVVTSGGVYVQGFSLQAPVAGYGRVTVTRGLGLDPWEMQRSASTPTGRVELLGYIARDSRADVVVLNAGASGSRTDHWLEQTGTPLSIGAAAAAAGANVAFIMLGVNDAASAKSAAQFEIDLSRVGTDLGSMPLVFMTMVPSAPGSIAQARQDEFNAVIRRVAQTQGASLLDVAALLGPQGADPGRGFYADAYHLTPIANRRIADFITDALKGA